MNKRCDAGFLNYDALEKEVIGWLLLDQDEDFVALLDKKPTRKVVTNAGLRRLREQQARLIDLAASGVMNSKMVAEKLNELEMQLRHHETVVQEREADERMFTEKARALVERHDNAGLGDDQLERISVFAETRDGNKHLCKFSVRFRGYEGEPEREHEHERPELIRVKGVWKGRDREADDQ